jgi:hypothetical protein
MGVGVDVSKGVYVDVKVVSRSGLLMLWWSND